MKTRLTKKDLMAVRLAERDGPNCVLCGIELPEHGHDVHLRTVVPRSFGAPRRHDYNVVRSCADCARTRSGQSLGAAAVSALVAGNDVNVAALTARFDEIERRCGEHARRHAAQQHLLLHGSERRRERLEAVLERDEHRCVWCSRELQYGDGRLTLDHVHPKAHGGGNALDNLVCSCRACNHERGDTDARDWAALCRDRGQRVNERILALTLSRAHQYELSRQAA